MTTPVTGDGTAVRLTALATAFDGRVLTPGDDGYDDARRIWNGLIDRRPAVIARCASTADVARSVRFARDEGLLIAVRGGGHNIAGNCVCDGGLVIDLSEMTNVGVDPEQRTARAQGGTKLGGFDAATQAHGLAATMGIASDTGVAGLTLGGGYGWLAGRYGLACDTLIEAELVTADGDVVTANEGESADLLWGLRGGGGNFGIATTLTYTLHPVGPVLGGMVIYPRSVDALRFFDDYARGCPDEVSTACLLTTAPDGSPAIAFLACHCGPIDDEAERALAPLRNYATPLMDMIEPRSYVEMQMLTDEAWMPGNLYYWRSSLVREITADLADVLIAQAEGLPTPASVIYLQQLHGAAGRVPADATAFPHRFDHLNCGAMLQATDPAVVDHGIAWARTAWDAIQPFAERSNYVNDLGDEGNQRVREAYGPNYERLLALKTTYDPDNLFRLNQNIVPTA